MTITLADAELDVTRGFVCRSCGSTSATTFLDLGEMPLANAYLPSPDAPDPRFPLHARLCRGCLLVQADSVVAPANLFSDYAFFSSYSKPWVEHCREYAEKMMTWLAPESVFEVASNDGCLLEQFPKEIRRLGVDPAANIAQIAREKGIPTHVGFFTEKLARQSPKSDLVVANNVLGHVPDLNDFVAGLALVLKPEGVLSVEVPWLLKLIEGCEFDTIYHEHFNYFSYRAAQQLFARHGLRVFDIDQLDIHGGSLRFYACHEGAGHRKRWSMMDVEQAEFDAGLHHTNSLAYCGFVDRVKTTVAGLRRFLEVEHGAGCRIAGAGAPAKGNTLLNAVGADSELIQFVTDVSPHKQGMFLPGSRIPILSPGALTEYQPDYVLVLAWNWAEEIMRSLAFVRDWGAKFVLPVPKVRIV